MHLVKKTYGAPKKKKKKTCNVSLKLTSRIGHYPIKRVHRNYSHSPKDKGTNKSFQDTYGHKIAQKFHSKEKKDQYLVLDTKEISNVTRSWQWILFFISLSFLSFSL